jgi:hypothetical protein
MGLETASAISIVRLARPNKDGRDVYGMHPGCMLQEAHLEAGLATQTLRFVRNRDSGLKQHEQLGGRQRSPTGRPGGR